jgi:hypothetical protein
MKKTVTNFSTTAKAQPWKATGDRNITTPQEHRNSPYKIPTIDACKKASFDGAAKPLWWFDLVSIL